MATIKLSIDDVKRLLAKQVGKEVFWTTEPNDCESSYYYFEEDYGTK